MQLTFEKFQQVNYSRAIKAFPAQCLEIGFLSLAIAGESGELANIIKKHFRGDFDDVLSESLKSKMVNEAADIITYCDLFISHMKRDTERELKAKWNEVSLRRNYPVRL